MARSTSTIQNEHTQPYTKHYKALKTRVINTVQSTKVHSICISPTLKASSAANTLMMHLLTVTHNNPQHIHQYTLLCFCCTFLRCPVQPNEQVNKYTNTQIHKYTLLHYCLCCTPLKCPLEPNKAGAGLRTKQHNHSA